MPEKMRASKLIKKGSVCPISSDLVKVEDRSNIPSSHIKVRGARLDRPKRRRSREHREVEGVRLGAKPFIAATNLYLKSREGLIAPSTYKEENKKLRYIDGLLQDLKANGKIRTTDPRHIGRAEIQAFFGKMRGMGLDPTTQQKYVQLLNGLLKHFNNYVIEQMKKEGVKMPKETSKGIRALSVEESDGLIVALSKPQQWDEAVMLGCIALGLTTGCRPKELRLAELADLDLKNGKFYVRHPKGEGSWASPQWVQLVRDDLVPHLKTYLEIRKRRLEKKESKECHALFPCLGNHNRTGFYSASNFNRMKRVIELRTGIEFRIKDLRSTLASQTVDIDPALLNSVSSQLRHCDVKTTQKYYAAMKEGRAGEELREAWKSKTVKTPKTPLLTKHFEQTGYW